MLAARPKLRLLVNLIGWGVVGVIYGRCFLVPNLPFSLSLAIVIVIATSLVMTGLRFLVSQLLGKGYLTTVMLAVSGAMIMLGWHGTGLMIAFMAAVVLTLIGATIDHISGQDPSVS